MKFDQEEKDQSNTEKKASKITMLKHKKSFQWNPCQIVFI